MRSASKFLQLLRDAKASGVLVEEVTWARLGQITGGSVHQGIALQTAAAETLDLDSLIEGCSDLGEPPVGGLGRCHRPPQPRGGCSFR